jgi:hypothetical protein
VGGGQHAAAARAGSAAFKPVVAKSRDEYYDAIRQRFNAIDGLTTEEKLPVDFAAGCSGLADVWAAVERNVSSLRLTTRHEIAQLAFFMADTVYSWPAPEILSWIKRHEEALGREAVLRRFSTIVGWGTGSAFQTNHQLIGRDLAFVIDIDASKSGRSVVAGQRFQPLVDLVAYYTEVERYYPRLFSHAHMELRLSA